MIYELLEAFEPHDDICSLTVRPIIAFEIWEVENVCPVRIVQDSYTPENRVLIVRSLVGNLAC